MGDERDYETEAMEAVLEFATRHGRCWRSKLRMLWTSGKDGAGLRLARNIIGPSGLDKLVVDATLRATIFIRREER